MFSSSFPDYLCVSVCFPLSLDLLLPVRIRHPPVSILPSLFALNYETICVVKRVKRTYQRSRFQPGFFSFFISFSSAHTILKSEFFYEIHLLFTVLIARFPPSVEIHSFIDRFSNLTLIFIR